MKLFNYCVIGFLVENCDKYTYFQNLLCSHAAELKKLKELHAATEKLRREKWVKEETKRIKV